MAETTILLSNNDFTKNTIVGGNVDYDRFLPSVKACQQTKIKQLLGKTLYDKICLDFENGTLTGLYEEMYDDYIKMLVIHGSAEIFLTNAAYFVTNNGITKAYTESSETVKKEEVDYLVQASRSLYKDYEIEFLQWIKDNGDAIPEINNNPTNVTKNGKVINVGGWLLKRPNDNCNNNQ